MRGKDRNRVDQAATLVFACILATLLVLLTWNLAHLNAEHRHAAEQDAKEYADRTHDRIERTCVGMDGAAYVECADQIVKATHDAQTAQHDLAAQRGMELWAQAMFWATLATVVVAAAGIYYVRQTLLETRRIGQAQVRAYLQLQMSAVDYVKAPSGDGIRLKGKLMNRGQSPSLHVEVGGWVGIEMPETAPPIDPRITLSRITSYMAPGVEHEGIQISIPFATFLAGAMFERPLWFLIVVKSEDVFSDPQYAFFRGQFIASDKLLSANELQPAMSGGRVHVSNA